MKIQSKQMHFVPISKSMYNIIKNYVLKLSTRYSHIQTDGKNLEMNIDDKIKSIFFYRYKMLYLYFS